jgi:hypothetical protein
MQFVVAILGERRQLKNFYWHILLRVGEANLAVSVALVTFETLVHEPWSAVN